MCCSPKEREFVLYNGESASSNVKNISLNVKRKLVDFWKNELEDVGQEFVDIIAFQKCCATSSFVGTLILSILRIILDELLLVVQN